MQTRVENRTLKDEGCGTHSNFRSYFKLTDCFSGRLCEEPPTSNV